MSRSIRIGGLSMALALALGGCGTGQQLAAGPVFGYIRGRGYSAGWEAGGGPMHARSAGGDPVPDGASLIARFNVGMSWRPGAPGTDVPERLTYAAWEPWFLVGGTAGVAHSSSDGLLHPLLGAWEAAPYVFGATGAHNPLRTCSPCYTVALAIGWRWSGDSSEFYLAPKLGILNDTTMPFPFQSYAD